MTFRQRPETDVASGRGGMPSRGEAAGRHGISPVCDGPAVSDDRSPYPKTTRRGFTILELLLASMLAAVLMAGLWSLLSTYERLFASGETRTERSQLVRSVLDQLSDDLTSAIADNAASPSGGRAAVRRFGLFGTSEAFQVDVLQTPPFESIAGSLDEEASDLGAGRDSKQVPELRTVQWQFEAAEGETRPGRPSSSGLTRREMDWETPGAKGGGILASARRSREASSMSAISEDGSSAEAAAGMEAPASQESPDEPVLRVPEVVGVEFRYFDGSTWSSEWNSLTRKSLPIAVEIMLRIKREETLHDRSKLPQQSERMPAAVAQAESPEVLQESAGESHRLVVYLPSTTLARRMESAKPSMAGPRPLPAYRPLLTPSPRPMPGGPPRSAPTALSDQWMRTGQ